jgi:Flp pilus assembly protein TadG
VGRIAIIRCDRGQTAVEFAMVLPLLTVLLLAIVQLGIAFNHYVTLTDATRAAARRAIVLRLAGGASNAAKTQEAKTAALNAAGSLDQSKLTVTVSCTSDPTVDCSDWSTPGPDVTVTATYPYKIDLMGFVFKQGNITSTQKERIE